MHTGGQDGPVVYVVVAEVPDVADDAVDAVGRAVESGGLAWMAVTFAELSDGDVELARAGGVVPVLVGRDDPVRDAGDVRRATHAAVVAVIDDRPGEVLAAGVDDVVAVDAVAGELLARLETRARRRALLVPDNVELRGLRIDRGARAVHVDGARVELTPREFDLLSYLAATTGRLVSREELLRDVWGSSSDWQQERTVNEHVRRLRNKIGDRWIVTIRGYGYRFVPDPG